MRKALRAAVDLAVDAFVSSLRLLEKTLYRPALPLWERSGEGERPPVVGVERVEHVIGLIGLTEAYTHLLGESPVQNPAVAELARRLVVELATYACAQGALQGLRVRVEEPWLELGAERLAGLDLESFPSAARRALQPVGTRVVY